MGLVKNKNEFWDYVSENGITYELLEGSTIGGNTTYTSDICFILLDDSDAEYSEMLGDERFVGFMYGATFLTDTNPDTRDEFTGYIKKIVDQYEKAHPDIIEKFKPKKDYLVCVERYGYFEVKARSENEAIKIAEQMDDSEIKWNDDCLITGTLGG